jgi:hypothetical protein
MRESCVNGARDQCGGAISLLRISNALLLVVGCNDLLFVVTALGVDFPGLEFGAAEEAAGGVAQ